MVEPTEEEEFRPYNPVRNALGFAFGGMGSLFRSMPLFLLGGAAAGGVLTFGLGVMLIRPLLWGLVIMVVTMILAENEIISRALGFEASFIIGVCLSIAFWLTKR